MANRKSNAALAACGPEWINELWLNSAFNKTEAECGLVKNMLLEKRFGTVGR